VPWTREHVKLGSDIARRKKGERHALVSGVFRRSAPLSQRSCLATLLARGEMRSNNTRCQAVNTSYNQRTEPSGFKHSQRACPNKYLRGLYESL
jgi:hypothetical protein